MESEEGEQVEAAAPHSAPPQQQVQGPDASPFSKKELKRQRKQQQQQLQQQQQQQQQRHQQQEEAACVANPSHPHGKHTVFASSDEEGSKVRLLPRLDAALVSAVRCGAVKMKVVLLVACLSGPAVCLAIFAVALALHDRLSLRRPSLSYLLFHALTHS